MSCLYDNHHSKRMKCFLNAVFYLLCHSFLNLQSMAIYIYYPCNLTKTCYIAIGNIRHMRLAIKRKHVMFTHREEINILDYHHLVVLLFKEGIRKHLVRVLFVTSCQDLHGFCHSHRSLKQAISLWVLSQQFQYFPVMQGEVCKSLSIFWFLNHKIINTFNPSTIINIQHPYNLSLLHGNSLPPLYFLLRMPY